MKLYEYNNFRGMLSIHFHSHNLGLDKQHLVIEIVIIFLDVF